MQLKNTVIRENSVDELTTLLAKDIKEISDKYSFAFTSSDKAIALMNLVIKKKYSKIINSSKEEIVDFSKTLEQVMNNYVESIFSKENDEEYIKLFNNYMYQKIGEIPDYKQIHYELKKIVSFFETINYCPSEIMSTTLLKNNSKFSTIIGQVVKKFSKRIAKSNIEDVFPNPTMLSFVSAYAYLNKIKLKSEENFVEESSLLQENETYVDDDVVLYIQSLPNRLKISEERELFIKIKNGDLEAKNKLVSGNLRLVIPIAKRYLNHGVKFLDLIQEGNLGLIAASEKFDYERGCTFSTYANWWVKQYIYRSIMNDGRTIRIPIHIHEKLAKYNKVYDELGEKLGRNPMPEELAREMHITDNQIYGLMSANTGILSLDAPIKENSDDTLAEIIKSDDLSVEEQYEKSSLVKEVDDLLDNVLLKKRDIEIIKLRNGFYNNRRYSLKEISDIFNISSERVRQIEVKAYEILRKTRYSSTVVEYLENSDSIKKRVAEEISSKKEKEELAKNRVNSEKITDVKKIYTRFNGYTRKEIAEVIATLPEEDIMAMHDVFGPRLEKLCYRSSSLESNRERISNQVLDYIEEKLATNYIRVIKYCTNCSGIHFDYDLIEQPDSFYESNFDFDELKCSQKIIKKSLRASIQEDAISNTLNTNKLLTKNKVFNNKSSQPKILIYK